MGNAHRKAAQTGVEGGMTPYTLVRSDRRTLSLLIKRDGSVEVRAPRRLPRAEIDRFVAGREAWIRENRELVRQRAAATDATEAEISVLKAKAAAALPDRVAYYAARMGVTPTGVTITRAKTRFGSCSPSNRLCFSCFLMRYPPAAIDYVVVHELAHILHKDHGPAFYAVVASVLPDHRERRKLLRACPAAT